MWRRTDSDECSSLSGAEIACGLEAAGAASRLRHLDLSFNGLGNVTSAALGRALAAQGPEGALRKLCLSDDTQIGSAAAGHLAKGLRVNSTLEALDLAGNSEMGPEGAAAIIRGIAGMGGTPSGVRTLSLASCMLIREGDVGAGSMLEAGLRQNVTLTALDLRANGFREAGCLALAHWAAARFGAAPGHFGELGSGAKPSPLLLNLFFCDSDAVLRAAVGPIVERANAAAAAAGWRYKGRSALTIEYSG